MRINYSPSIAETKQNVKPRRNDKSPERNWIGKLRLYFKRATLLIMIIMFSIAVWSVSKFALKSPYFALENLNVTSTEHISKDEIIAESGVLPRTNLARVSIHDIENRLRQNTWVKSVSIIKHYPSTLVIQVSERKPLALVVGKETWGVDEQGRILPGLNPNAATQFPLITVNDKLTLPNSDAMDDEGMKKALFILLKIKHDDPNLLPQISEINIANPDSLLLYTQPDGTEVRLGNTNLEERLTKFFKIWKVSQDRKIVQEYIDLRFDEQGVVTKPKIIKNPRKPKSPST